MVELDSMGMTQGTMGSAIADVAVWSIPIGHLAPGTGFYPLPTE